MQTLVGNSIFLDPELWGHQKKVVTEALNAATMKYGYYGLFHEMGTGKSRSTVNIIRNLFTWHKRPLRTLILCPAIVVDNWAKEIDRFSKCGQFVQKLQGKGTDRARILKESKKSIFITNYEALHMEGLFWEAAGKEGKERKLIDRGFEVLICDELHKLKGYASKSTKLVIRMADRIPYRYGLTGSPILNTPMDIWPQFRILDQGKRFGDNFFAFRNTYFQDKNAAWSGDKRFSKWILKDGAMEEISKKMSTCSSRVLKRDCLDLPPLIMQRVDVGMSPKQEKAYKEMKDNLVTYLNGAACVATIALTKILRLLQITSGYVKLDTEEEISFPDSPRLSGLEDILEGIGEQKCIIWCAFKHNYKDVTKVCDSLGLKHTSLTGEQNQKQKELSVEEFNNGDKQIMIANPAAGGVGVNLTSASMSIWFSRSHSLGDRLQALARNHRGGSERHEKILCIDLVCPGSIEESVLASLEAKENISDSILNIRKLLTV